MIHMEQKMPRKKKTPSLDFQKSQQVAMLIYKILTQGDKYAKAEVIARLMMEEQYEFIEQIKTMMELKEYYRVVEIC